MEIILSRKSQVKAYVLQTEKDGFVRYCARQGMTESDVLRRYIRKVAAAEKGKK